MMEAAGRRFLACCVALTLGSAVVIAGQKRDAPGDRVATLNEALAHGTRLERDPRIGYLRSVLDALAVPVDSQLLVFSKTGAQRAQTGPQHPRALFFNDAVAVGYLPDAPAIEVASHVPGQGVTFYTLDQTAATPSFVRQTSCLSCHVSSSTLGVPGYITRSHIVGDDGSVLPLPSHEVDHRTPHTERWGGWYVTSLEVAQYNHLAHLGNITFSGPMTSNQVFIDWLASEPEQRGYLSGSSDIAALLVFDHQMHALNLMTKLTLPDAAPDLATELADYLLFKDEAPVSPPVTPRPGFAASLAARVPKDHLGRSFGQLDLSKRLLRYPCSFMIYSEAFDGMPRAVKDAVFRRMLDRLPPDGAVVEILRETKPDFPR